MKNKKARKIEMPYGLRDRIVAVDIDGTIADYPNWFLRYVHDVIGMKAVPFVFPPNFNGSVRELIGVDEETYRTLKNKYRNSGIKKDIPLKPGALNFLGQLRELGFMVVLCSSRPKESMDDTFEWIYRYKVPSDVVILSEESKYQYLLDEYGQERIELVIDDDPESVRQAESLGLRSVLLPTSINAAQDLKNSRELTVMDYQEIIHYLGGQNDNDLAIPNSTSSGDLVAPHEQAARIAELQKEWLQLYFKKAADYGEGANHLGLAGQYAEIYRKMKKLEKAMWCGEPLFNEQLDEVLMDLIGHAFLSIDFIRNGDPGLKKGQN